MDVDYCSNLKVQGDVKDISTTSGDVSITGNVTGSIQATSGDIDVRGNVGGSVQTSSGDVECYEVAGNVKTRSGDIDKKFR